MSRIEDVLVPPNQEGTRATILRWCKAVGDSVAKDEPLVELETDKVTVEIPAPASGTLIEVLKPVNAEVSPDEVLARLRLADAAMVDTATADAATASAAMASAAMAGATTTDAAVAAPAPAAGGGQERLSPSVRRLLREHSLAPGDIRGTGRDGRVTA